MADSSELRDRIASLLARAGVERVNAPKMTPSHPTAKAVVVARDGDEVALIRFGAKGYPHNYSASARAAFKARHAANIARGKLSAAYWADRFLWAGPEGSKLSPAAAKRKGRRDD